jgi:hypothetical protein
MVMGLRQKASIYPIDDVGVIDRLLMVNYKKKKSVVVHSLKYLAIGFLVAWFMPHAIAADDAAQQSALDAQVQNLRNEALILERDIGLLEKELLFPPLTRVEVYLSMQPELDYKLRSVVLEIDGEEKSFHIYSESDMAALRVGGMQSFWEGNVALGTHQLVATFKGEDPKGRPLGGTTQAAFKKTRSGLALELQVLVGKNEKTPKFAVKDWGEK